MKERGEFLLRDRRFVVREARIVRSAIGWAIEINTESGEYDGELWEPYLYHQGLRLDATTAKQLEGTSVAWTTPDSPGYDHPEIGALYVFGHHLVEDAVIQFGEFADGAINIEWQGVADVLWSEPFVEKVPFRCLCRADAHEG